MKTEQKSFRFKSLICLYLIIQSSFAFSNENTQADQTPSKNGEVTINFIYPTAYLATICTENGCSPWKGYNSSETINLPEGKEFCVSANFMPGIISIDNYFVKTDKNNALIEFSGLNAGPKYKSTENIKHKLKDYNDDIYARYCRRLKYLN